MSITTAIVCLVGMGLVSGLIGFALYYKGNVKAGARIKGGELFIEAQEPRWTPKSSH